MQKYRKSPPILSSPEPIDNFSINLVKGKAPSKNWSTLRPDQLIWNNYDEIDFDFMLRHAIKYIQEEYKEHRVLEGSLTVDSENNRVFLSENLYATEIKNNYSKKVFAEIEKCFEPYKQGSKGPKTLSILTGMVGAYHAMSLVINNVSREIELYDPNGDDDYYQSARKPHRDFLITYFSDIAKKKGFKPYKFLPMKKTRFPAFNIAVDKDYYDEGMCVLFSIYIIHLRLMHFEKYSTAELFSRSIYSRINQLRAGADDYSGYILRYFLEYVSFMEDTHKKYLDQIERERDARLINDQSRKPKSAPKPVLKPTSKPAPLADNLTGLTVKQLQDLAKKLGLKGYSKLRKLELIQVLHSAGA